MKAREITVADLFPGQAVPTAATVTDVSRVVIMPRIGYGFVEHNASGVPVVYRDDIRGVLIKQGV